MSGCHEFALTNLAPATVYCYRITSTTTNRTGMTAAGYFATPGARVPPMALDQQIWMMEDAGLANFYVQAWNPFQPDTSTRRVFPTGRWSVRQTT